MSRQAVVRAVDHSLDLVDRALVGLSTLAFLAIALIIVAAIVARQYLGLALPDDVVIVEQLMVVGIAASLAHVTRIGGHIAIDLLYVHLGARQRRLCDRLGAVVGLVAFVPVAIWGFDQAFVLHAGGRYYFGELSLPKWPAMLVFAIGVGLLCVRLALSLVGAHNDGDG